eukprot:gene13773-35199_t
MVVSKLCLATALAIIIGVAEAKPSYMKCVNYEESANQKMGGNWKSWNDGSADNMDPSFQALPEPIFHDGEGGLTFRLPAGQKGFIIQVRGVTQDVSSTFAASSGDCGVLYSEGDGVQEIAEKDISFNLQANVPDTVNVEIFFAYGSGQGPLTYRVLGTSFYPPAPRTTTTTTTSVTTTTATTTTIAAYPLYEEMDFGGCPWNRDRNARDFVRDRGDCIDAAKQLGLWANTFHTLPEAPTTKTPASTTSTTQTGFTLHGASSCSGKNEICSDSQPPCNTAANNWQKCAELCSSESTCVSFEYGLSGRSSGKCQLSTTCTEDNMVSGDPAWQLWEKKTVSDTISSEASNGTLGTAGQAPT